MENVVTVIGTEDFLVKQKIDSLQTELGCNENNLFIYDMEEDKLEDVLEELETFPFLEEHKIILMNNPVFLEKETGFDSFIEYLKKPMEVNYLIINASHVKWNKQNKYCKALELFSKMIILTENVSLNDYCLLYCEKAGYSITKEACQELIERVGDLNFLYSELSKLMLYKDNQIIDIEDVKEMVSISLEEDVFQLTNAFVAKDTNMVYTIYKNLLSHNEDPLRIMNALTRKMLEILNTKFLIRKKASKEEIASFFKVSSGRAYYMIKTAKEVKMEDLNSYIASLANLDYGIKSGRMDKNLGLELFLLNKRS